jgi:nicotinamidase/pyrazinamidase
MRIDCIIIDGENDFLASGKEPWNTEKRMGSLYVAGADQEALTVASLIDHLALPEVKLHATLDAHHLNDCAHNTSWKGPDGTSPPPFTMVTHDDVVKQRWVPVLAAGVWEGDSHISAYQWALNYTKALEVRGRNPLILWPPHCVIGEWGSCVYQPLADAYRRWCEKTHRWISYITKGQWPWTEHYSAIVADVPDSTRPETQLNTDLIRNVNEAELVVWTGWAGSHCLKWTALDAVNFFGKGENEFLQKSVFLSDCCAAVGDQPGSTLFADWRKEFLDEVQQRGAAVKTAAEFLQTLRN